MQRQLTNKTSIEIAYVGNHGTHVFKGTGNTYNANQATVVGFLPHGGLSFNERSPYNTAFTTSYTDANGVTRPWFVALDRDSNYNGNDGINTYKALKIKVDHRLPRA